MTNRGKGILNVPTEIKSCGHCRETYHGTVRSLYCSASCKEAAKHARRMADPDRRVQAVVRRAKARQKLGYRARKRKAKRIPYTAEELESKAEYWDNLCWICRAATPTCWDHVKPLIRGGPDILANLRPACNPCNSKKNAKWPFPTTRKTPV